VLNFAPTIQIQGGTYTDKQHMKDMAQQVSDTIMRNLRLQGLIPPQW
jgi:hypothetical protein